jgi:hypothetical protein
MELHKIRKHINVLLGCVYIPPEFSPYSSDEAFLQLEDELITHSPVIIPLDLLISATDKEKTKIF